MKRLKAGLLLFLLGLPVTGNAYPLDGYGESGIRRVEGARLAVQGVITGTKQPPGALKPLADVDLRLLDHRDLELPPADPAFTAQITRLLGGQADRYGVAVLDLSDPAHPRYAEHRGEMRQNVGSVGKLVVALAVFQALADIWPEDVDARTRVLRETVVTADSFIHTDHHKVRLFDVENRKLTKRPLREGDQGTLWEYLDWMLSASSNAAASMCMREAMLLRHYGKDYPPPAAEIERFFDGTPKPELTELYISTFFEPVTRNGLDLEQLRQGSFFTHTGKRRVPGGGNSYGTARELMKYLLRMEQGRLVDIYSSRQIKRLLYMTEWRIRYASSPALRNSAVYFKSGSLYKCKPEADFKCGKYMGNVRNYMNSVAIVETDSDDWQLDYMVTLISNVLRKNSAVDHQTLATRIHRLIEKEHPVQVAAPAALVESVESAEAVEAAAPVDPPEDTGDAGDSR
ncbi:MAG TPA: serine hydrolase [Gammaproteobacteria bacterium]|nr:serine hydrolase [Gammaproteobacteria bacterium]